MICMYELLTRAQVGWVTQDTKHLQNDPCFYLTHLPLAGHSGSYFADDIFSCIFVNEKNCILIKISLKFVPKGPIDNNPALF